MMATTQIQLMQMPQLAEAVDKEDDWTGVTDAAARRKRQNRLNVRAYRRRKALESQVHSAPISTSTFTSIATTESTVPCWIEDQQTVSILPASIANAISNAKNPLIPYESTLPNPATSNRSPPPRIIFPLSSDHLITLLQYNVLRGCLTNRLLLSTHLSLTQSTCAPSTLSMEPHNPLKSFLQTPQDKGFKYSFHYILTGYSLLDAGKRPQWGAKLLSGRALGLRWRRGIVHWIMLMGRKGLEAVCVAVCSQTFSSIVLRSRYDIMDPLSITVSVVSLVATSTKLLRTFSDYRAQYNMQDISTITIRVQCDCILVALAQIQAVFVGNQQMAARLMSDDSFSGQRLKSVLGACELTFSVVVGRLSKITEGIGEGGKSMTKKEKFERLWKESDIAELSKNISRLSDGLNLLLTAFNMKSQLEMQQVLTSSRGSIILDQVEDDASSIMLVDSSASHISGNTALLDLDPMSHTEIDSKDFDFDQEVLMTTAYRKVEMSKSKSSGATPLNEEDYEISTTKKPFSEDQMLPTQSSNETTDQNREAKGTLTEYLNTRRSDSNASRKQKSEKIAAKSDKPLISNQQYRVERLGAGRKVTLKDFMPKPTGLSQENSDSTLIATNTTPKERLYVSSKEVNISGFDMIDLAESAVEAVKDTIKSLFLYHNKISRLPKSIASCSNLAYLNLKSNYLSVFPLEICSLKSLKILHVSENELSELPEQFLDLNSLEVLDIALNRFTHLPLFLVLMDNLTTIYAHNNPFVHPALQQWQEEYCGYYAERAREGAPRLKSNIRDQWSAPTTSTLPSQTSPPKILEMKAAQLVTWNPFEYERPSNRYLDSFLPKVSLDMIMDGSFVNGAENKGYVEIEEDNRSNKHYSKLKV
ncbi:hypothetical protein G7Y89_g6393 [Cudoniella acicularis]|uniref:BZIP domain-containing protein n=1 Tax=Cudoniella acicularis TaxID=354080 RepID=A0A8H4RLD2_9HELO|nr:hypothetical protein G7Y89_g6393 [Cudoniella acicularis]